MVVVEVVVVVAIVFVYVSGGGYCLHLFWWSAVFEFGGIFDHCHSDTSQLEPTHAGI